MKSGVATYERDRLQRRPCALGTHPTNTAIAAYEIEIPTEEAPAATTKPDNIPTEYSNNGRKRPSTVGAQQINITQLDFPEIKEACNARGIKIH